MKCFTCMTNNKNIYCILPIKITTTIWYVVTVVHREFETKQKYPLSGMNKKKYFRKGYFFIKKK